MLGRSDSFDFDTIARFDRDLAPDLISQSFGDISGFSLVRKVEN